VPGPAERDESAARRGEEGAHAGDPDASESDAQAKPGKDSADSSKRGRGRASIPSWDDILFGTRSEDDPA